MIYIDLLHDPYPNHPLLDQLDQKEWDGNQLNLWQECFQFPWQHAPFAALSALGEDILPQNYYWIRLEPIRLTTSLQAMKAPMPPLSLLTDLFLSYQLYLIPGREYAYLYMSFPPQMKSCVLPSHLHASHLPRSLKNSPVLWEKLFIEIQMILKDQEANALWLWGEGQLDQPPLIHKKLTVATDQYLVKGLCQWLDLPIMEDHADFYALSYYHPILDQLLDTDQEVRIYTPKRVFYRQKSIWHKFKSWFK